MKKEMTISIQESFEGKTILLTGSTSFLGKVLLLMLVEHVPTMERLVLVVQKKSYPRVLDRFEEKIFHCPQFLSLSPQRQRDLVRLVNKKVVVLDADIGAPMLGIKDSNPLLETVDLVINCCEDVHFNIHPKSILRLNVFSLEHVVAFVNASKKARLLHLSSAFVAGNQSGYIAEDFLPAQFPSKECIDLEECVQKVTKADHKTLLALRDAWGFATVYQMSKFFAEKYLLATCQKPCGLFRPSIMESAKEYPYPGWVEGFNTCAPFLYTLKFHYPFVIANRGLVLDIVPVDYAMRDLIRVASVMFQCDQNLVVHSSSSGDHPITMGRLCASVRDYYRAKHPKQTLEHFFNTRCVSSHHPMAPNQILSKARRVKEMFQSHFTDRIYQEIKVLSQVGLEFKPFTCDNSYCFEKKRLDQYTFQEPFFQYCMKDLDWHHYLHESTMPGLEKFVFGSKKTLP